MSNESSNNTLNVSFDAIHEAIANSATHYHAWTHLLAVLSTVVNEAASIDDKITLCGFIFHTIRQHYLEGRMRLNRKHHLDPLVDMMVTGCKMSLGQLEKALEGAEDENQYDLAKKTYSIFTGLIIQKLIGIPDTYVPKQHRETEKISSSGRYAGARFTHAPEASALPMPYFKSRQLVS